MKKIILITTVLVFLTSCVSKKKYVALEEDLTITRGELQKTTIEKEEIEARFAVIKKRVADYNTKITSLTDSKTSLEQVNSSLQESNNEKLVLVADNMTVLSKNMRDKMNVTLSKMSSEELAGAKTLKDSINLAISSNLRKSIQYTNVEGEKDINVNIDKTVVMISVADDMLFKSGSHKINSKANDLLQKLADVINSEPSMDVMIEGHTDTKTINTGCLKDNWDLSVKRATSIVRLLQSKYNVDPSRLIASGRGSYVPLTGNETADDRARNRRTNIIILPNLNKFFALLAAEEEEILN
ncbi:MAG: OmpA family protein [Flavobacteriaceae bacterium]|nr:OmpA family protein [Flavobacteriaceae bacterium]